MNRADIINCVIRKINATSYLEIGVAGGETFASVDCQKKIGIDPNSELEATYNKTSDDFFEENTDSFDVIFVDGLHHAHQVEKDINNSLKILNDGGYVICHDMNPHNEIIQMVPQHPQSPLEWTGDCWKAWVSLRTSRNDIEMCVVDTDYGCGLIRMGSQQVVDLSGLELNWNNFSENRYRWLNLISVKEFERRMSSIF